MLVHLLVPAEIPKLENALARGADALWLAGRSSAVADCLRAARQLRPGRQKLYVHIESRGETIEQDLDELIAAAPDGIVLPVSHGAEVEHLGVRLAVREAELGLEDGTTQIIGLIAAPAAIFQLRTLAATSRRLVALSFDARAFANALDVSDGDSGPLNLARHLTVLAAKAAGIPALLIDNETESLATTAKRDGFDGIVRRAP